MPALETQIDELYRGSLAEFTAARNALAKTLSGDEARRVKQLKKPTVVPWAINQLYWQARPTYDRLIKSGGALRDAQIASLTGKDVDVRRVSEAHRKAVAEAVERATALAEADGSKPGPEPLARMLEAISLAAREPDEPGRFTDIIQPAGFEALTGIKPALPKPREQPHADAKAREVEARRKAAEIRAAERRVERARAADAKARSAHDRAREELRAAEQTLAAARLGK